MLNIDHIEFALLKLSGVNESGKYSDVIDYLRGAAQADGVSQETLYSVGDMINILYRAAHGQKPDSKPVKKVNLVFGDWAKQLCVYELLK